VRIWAVREGRVLAEFAAHTGPVSALAPTSDGTGLLSAGTDGRVRLWPGISP
jgi:WD40 repeat protein